MIRLIRSSAIVLALAGVSVAGVSGLARAVPSVDASSSDAKAIMQAVHDHTGGPRSLSRMKMSIKEGSSSKDRSMTSRSLRFADGRKSLLLIEDPADVRNTGFLSVDYSNKADEQWLYLPKVKRVARVPNSGKSDPFVGSDFSYSDLSQQNPTDYEFTIIAQSEKVGDEDTWHIAGKPKTETVRDETGYSQTELWVSKSKLIVVQLKATLLKDNKTKYLKASDIKQVDGVWSPFRMQMRTLQGGKLVSETLLEVLSLKNDAPEVSDRDFTQERLSRGI
jgi:hypothetical protein